MTRDEHRAKLAYLAEAFEREVLATPDDEIIAEMGMDEIRRVRSLLAATKASVSRTLLASARAEYEAWKAAQASKRSNDSAAAREAFDALKRKDAGFERKLMLAARNGRAPTEHDEAGLVDDVADLKRLEGEDEPE